MTAKLGVEIRILGIRHHGSGSCLRMLRALEDFEPEVICVELPPETGFHLPELLEPSNSAPLAFLLYHAQKPEQCYYLPLADFSPEYQAVRFGLSRGIDVRAMDMPAAHMLLSHQFKGREAGVLDDDQIFMIRDPLGYLAKSQGYEDSEVWWTQYFEHWTDHAQLFDMILQLMAELRKLSKGSDDEETLIREKFMRECIRKCLKEGFQKIAVVCGAWHGPVLTLPYLKKTEKESIRALKSVPVSCTLIPWSYERLMLNRSYSAGILSPSWNESLYRMPEAPISHWMSQAARAFREYGYQAGTAEIIDAERMAYNLSLLRGMPAPGIEELRDALISTLGQGDAGRVNLLAGKIFTGSRIGKISLERTELPMVTAFKKQLKILNLLLYWEESNDQVLKLDLRKSNHLEKSRLIHQSRLLQLDWAVEMPLSISAQGTFHEHWKFNWSPELEVQLIRSATLGNQIEEVILRMISEKLDKRSEDIALLGELLEHALKAGMDQLFEDLAQKIRELCLEVEDTERLALLLRPLIAGLSYGNLHGYSTAHCQNLISLILPRLVYNFGPQCVNIQLERAQKMVQVFYLIHSYFFHFQDEDLRLGWRDQVLKFRADTATHPLLRGRASFVAIDEGWISHSELGLSLLQECDPVSGAQPAARWIEGFLIGANAFYLLRDELIEILDNWVVNLSEEDFKEVLPLLRRSFSQVSYSENLRIFGKIRKLEAKENAPVVSWVLREELAEKALSHFQSWLLSSS